MSIRCILAELSGHMSDDSVLEAAWQVANRTQAHISVTHLVREYTVDKPAGLFAGIDRLMSRIDGLVPDEDSGGGDFDGEQAAREAEARQLFEAWRSRHDIPLQEEPVGEARVSTVWKTELTTEPAGLARAARLTDLHVLMRSHLPAIGGPDDPETVLIQTGRPALLVSDTQIRDLYRCPVIAWNGGVEAMRAVAAAMPLLAQAHRVTIFSRGELEDPLLPRVADLQRHLAWNGVAAELAAVTDPALSIGSDLLETCRAMDASLLVMGAYSQGPLREALFGGVTREILDEADIPVLMTH